MKKYSKKVISVILMLVLIMMFTFTSCGSEEGNDTYTIGICQLVQHEALDKATQGFKDALVAELGEENVVFDEQNASGESTVCTTIVNSFVSEKVDLIMANATASLQAAYNATESIPILGTSITEYGVALGLDNFSGVVGGNVSGTSDLAPLSEQADLFLELLPDAKTIGILYCSAEPNSEYQVKVVEEYLTGKGLTVKRFSFADSNDVATVTTACASSVDAIYIPTDNTAASCIETIANIIRGAKVPMIAGESGICTGGGIATLAIDYYDLGYKTGLMAVEILRDGKDISTMEIEYADATKYINKTVCDEIGLVLSDDILSDFEDLN